jgi:hypothetical protein
MTFIEEVQAKVQDILGFIEKQEVEHQRHINYLVKQIQEKDRTIRRFQTNMDLIKIAVGDGVDPVNYDPAKPVDYGTAEDLNAMMDAFLN